MFAFFSGGVGSCNQMTIMTHIYTSCLTEVFGDMLDVGINLGPDTDVHNLCRYV